MNEIYLIIIRCIISIIVLFLVTKILGKKQVSQLSLFDYVIGISIGNFAAETILDMDSPFINGMIAIIMFGLIAYMVSILTMKSIKLRRFFMGIPTPLIQEGKILEYNLKKVKFDINDLLAECRSNGYFDINEIEYALMESKGTVSILPKGENKPVTIEDMNLPPKKQSLTANVIIDGNIMLKNIKDIDKDEKWLMQQLKIKGYQNIKEILLATVDNNEKLTVYERNNEEKTKSILE